MAKDKLPMIAIFEKSDPYSTTCEGQYEANTNIGNIIMFNY